MNAVYTDLIYLLSCAVNDITPDNARVQAMDLERLYRLTKFHTVRAAVCIALKRAGVQDKQFDQAYKKAVRKNIYLDMERTAILSDFEQQGIWYMPLKGSVLKDLYPENGMREMWIMTCCSMPKSRSKAGRSCSRTAILRSITALETMMCI